uniref:Uncharacterized protein n=1 Tax=Anguilla anguilla TaxID=7936 RepID=A0A0E9X4S2_ANGAN
MVHTHSPQFNYTVPGYYCAITGMNGSWSTVRIPGASSIKMFILKLFPKLCLCLIFLNNRLKKCLHWCSQVAYVP